MSKTKVSISNKAGYGWFPYVVVGLALLAWAWIVHEYPVYFQRDDIKALAWTGNHSFVDCFIPTKDAALSHDGMYRPLRELVFLAQYRLFGLNSYAWHFTLGVVFILSLVFNFKIAARICGYRTACLSIALWILPFQYLLTNLFWFQDIPHVLEMLLACAGLYFFISGFGKSGKRIVLGIVLMLLSFLSKEPAVVILPTVVSAFVLTNGKDIYRWGRGKTLIYGMLPLFAVFAYLALFPAILHRQASADSSGRWVLSAINERLFYYSGYLTSKLALLLVIPAIYIILKRLLKDRGTVNVFPLMAIAAAALALGIAKLHLHPLGVIAMLVAGGLLPKRLWFLLVWIFVPFVGLCVFLDVIRSYLYEIVFGLSILSAIFANEMLHDFLGFWRARVTSRTVNYGAALLLVCAVCVVAAPQLKKQAQLMKLRSDITMNSKYIMPYVKQLPRGAVLVMIDYPSLGIDFRHDMTSWTDREKLLLQSPLNCQGTLALGRWLKFIGRPDLTLIDYRTYSQNLGSIKSQGGIYAWTMTPLDRAFVRKVGLAGKVYAEVGQGDVKMSLLQITGDSRGSELSR